MQDSKHAPYLKIFHICSIILFIELFLIRWISTELNIFAYLQNSILVVCFLGLGMGLISPKPNASISQILLPFTLLSTILAWPAIAITLNSISAILGGFHDFVVWNALQSEARLTDLTTLIALGIVLLIARIVWAIMMTLGSILSVKLEQSPNPIKAYSCDMLGSLFGVLLFGLLGYLRLPPLLWVVIASGLLFCDHSCRTFKSILILSITICIVLLGSRLSTEQIYWTPYQKLAFSPTAEVGEWLVKTNNSGYQAIQDNSPEAMSKNPKLAALKGLNQYDIPSRFYPDAKNILVLGAGTGNDVAGALRGTKGQVTAVEIDKKIVELGNLYHPEKPYQSNRLTVVVNDARGAIQSIPNKSVDLLILGLLDSHTTPNLSSGRIDNFVYTRESFERMREILKDDGIIALLFQSQRHYIYVRLKDIMDSVFGKPTRLITIPDSLAGWGGQLFLNGDQSKILKTLESNPDLNDFFAKNILTPPPSASVMETTDSWPYLYIEHPMIPFLFWVLSAIFILLWTISSFQLRGHFIGPNLMRREDLHFFALGAAFSLVQTFSIYKGSVLFGSTWVVTTLVISGTLMMILLSNWLIGKVSISSNIVAALLILMVASWAFIPTQGLLSLDLYSRALAVIIISGLPMVLSGILFGRSFAQTSSRSIALGSNLFGALVGGILQYSTFLMGIPFVMLLAAGFYLLASFSLPRIKTNTACL